jgi:hypothetical protein
MGLNFFALPTAIACFAAVSSVVWAQTQPAATTDPRDSMHWQISPFIKGTTLEVRDEINGPYEQQLARKAEKLKRISDDNSALADQQDAVAVKLAKSSPEFVKLKADLEDARARAAAAKKASDPVTMFKAQDQATQDLKKIQEMEEPMMSGDPQVVAKRKDIANTKAELANLEPAVARASKARDQLVDGLRATNKLPGPPGVGKMGLLGRVKPTKIIDADSFLIDFQALEITGDDTNAKGPDGFKMKKAKAYPCKLLVTGVKTAGLKLGTEAIVDHTFSITSTKQIGKITVFVVAPASTEQRDQALDYLFDKLDEIRVP